MQLRVPYVNTVNNLADFFTKPLAKNDFFRMRDELMNVPSPDRIAVSRVRSTQVRGGSVVSLTSTTGYGGVLIVSVSMRTLRWSFI